MSLIQTYQQAEAEMKRLQEQMEELQNDERLQTELEFKSQVESLMEEYGKSVSDVVSLLDPQGRLRPSMAPKAKSGGERKKRKLKVYRNPETGEVVETRGGNQKTLKAWKLQYGADRVESWLERVEES